MLDDKKRAELEQALEEITETHPPLLRRYYLGLVKSGFNEREALYLTSTFLTGMMNTGTGGA